MKLKRFLLRYFPPGIILEYQRTNGEIETKSIDLLNLTHQTDIDSLVSQILFEEPMISEARRPQLAALITSSSYH
jgi:dynein assembly factor with WDR repeat domains 1